MEKFNAEVDRPLGEYTKQLNVLRKPYEKKLADARFETAVPELFRQDVHAALDTPPAKRDDVQKYLVKKFSAALKVTPEQVDKAMTDAERASAQELTEKIDTMKGWEEILRQDFRAVGYGQTRYHPFAASRRVRYARRSGAAGFHGDPLRRGRGRSQAARRQARRCPGISVGAGALDREPGQSAHRAVFVNRVWLQHFGKGIVATPENFGRMGAAPTHPELLDWLAVDFMQHGWQVKRLQKMIMLSSVYRQSSRQPADDVRGRTRRTWTRGNDLLWRMNLRRADAEAVRDSVLASSGKLDPKPGGPPVDSRFH